MINLKNVFNANTISGRANVAKATYASFAALYLFNRFRKRGKTVNTDSKQDDEFNQTIEIKEHGDNDGHNGGHNGGDGNHDSVGHHDEKNGEDRKCECQHFKTEGIHITHMHNATDSLDEGQPHELVHGHKADSIEKVHYHGSPAGSEILKQLNNLELYKIRPKSLSFNLSDGDQHHKADDSIEHMEHLQNSHKSKSSYTSNGSHRGQPHESNDSQEHVEHFQNTNKSNSLRIRYDGTNYESFGFFKPMEESQISPKSVSSNWSEGDENIDTCGKPVESNMLEKEKIVQTTVTNFEKMLGPYINLRSQHFEAYGDYDDDSMLTKDDENMAVNPTKTLDDDFILTSLDRLFRPYMRPREPVSPENLAESVEHDIFERKKSVESESYFDKFLSAYFDDDDPKK